MKEDTSTLHGVHEFEAVNINLTREPKKRTIEGRYYYIYVNEIVPHSTGCIDHDRSRDRIRFSVGNYFNTREEAEKVAREMFRLLSPAGAKEQDEIDENYFGKKKPLESALQEEKPVKKVKFIAKKSQGIKPRF